MPEKLLRRRHYSNPNLATTTTTSSPLFYSIPWSPMDYSVTGLGPGQSIRLPNNLDENNNTKRVYRCPCESRIDYSKSGFTFYRDTKCTCGFLSEYRKQFNEIKFKYPSSTCKPWWYGRELTSKFDPKHPCYTTHMQARSTYGQDYRGARGLPSQICFPEGQIEKAERMLDEKYRMKQHCCSIHCTC